MIKKYKYERDHNLFDIGLGDTKCDTFRCKNKPYINIEVEDELG